MEETIVEMQHISKAFPGVQALDDVSFSLRKGECMALLGENGAGKSTLVKILSGVYTRDSGTIRIFGKEVGEITPNIAKKLGVAIIHQELNMCQHLTVAENIFLGREICRKGGILDQAEMVRQSQKILDELSIDLDPNALVGELAVSKQQMVEIAKALSINAKILIMDEPTSSLTSKEITELFRIITKLKKEGHGIIYISHRLEELQHIVDRVTIMRDGKFITQGNFKDLSMDQIVAYMVGREIKEKFPRVEEPVGKTIFQVNHLNAGKMVHDVSFSVREGEILGIAGLMGAGRTETTRAIFGADPKESGEILLDGKPICHHPPDGRHPPRGGAGSGRPEEGWPLRQASRPGEHLPSQPGPALPLRSGGSEGGETDGGQGGGRTEHQASQRGSVRSLAFWGKPAEGGGGQVAVPQQPRGDLRRADTGH
jgi:ribose transport system ATP-binding protein